jgi:hypothetical protein
MNVRPKIGFSHYCFAVYLHKSCRLALSPNFRPPEVGVGGKCRRFSLVEAPLRSDPSILPNNHFVRWLSANSSQVSPQS